ncbi:MAG: ABC transporter ATP-binding protein [Atopococcus tabaci]|uniref:ABC transporter ATP-binding protein n=1 Tax=Atopococcus tabaci TaxID=269774 RepID=A0AA43UC87_9LACT|nr:ABC transporter ATP-binding protein [Atopococcus tabaci]
MSLKIEHLVGGYTRYPILHDISMTVDHGETVGLIGLNGAGKSTTIKHIMGLLKPFSGNISLNGKKLEEEPNEYRRSIGYVPETPALYEELTLQEHINMIQMSYDLPVERVEKETPELLKLFRLDGKEDWFPSNFSKGMQQKVMIVCALLTRPALFVIDEPFLGLDPIAIRDLIEQLDKQKARGSSILMSTHVLSTAEKICDRFIILHEGKVLGQGTLEELQIQYRMPSHVSLDELYIDVTGRGLL